MAVTTEQLQELAILNAARNPSWELQNFYTPSTLPGPPADTVPGISLDTDNVVSYVKILLRQDPSVRVAQVLVVSALDVSTYRVTTNGNNHDYISAAPDTTNDIYVGLKALLDVGPDAGNIVTTIAGGFLVITSTTPTSFVTLATSVPAGGGVMSHNIEADNCTFRVHGLAQNLTGLTTGQQFDMVDGGEVVVTARTNWIERLPTAGLAKLFIEPVSLDGTVYVYIGPATLES